MTFISLFSDEHGFVATDQRVFSPEELSSVNQVIDQAEQLEQQLTEHDAVLTAATAAAAEKGYQEAFEQAKADASEQLAKAMRQMHESQVKELQALRNNCAEMAVDIVRKIAGTTDPLAWTQAQAEQAANDLLDEPSLKLRVHGSHAEALRKRLAMSENQTIKSVQVDDTLAADACELETANGRIDIGLDTQLNAVLAAFGNAMPAYTNEASVALSQVPNQ